MGKTILDICGSCVSAINKAAWQSCRDGGTDEYNGCGVDVQVSPETTIYVYHDPNKGFAIESSHPSNNETPLFDKAVTSYLEEDADPEAEWQEAYGNYSVDCQTALDAGFGSWQDYYDYKY